LTKEAPKILMRWRSDDERSQGSLVFSWFYPFAHLPIMRADEELVITTSIGSTTTSIGAGTTSVGSTTE
jgi:hypothetical protein